MTDITARLRRINGWTNEPDATPIEAADEIERLEGLLKAKVTPGYELLADQIEQRDAEIERLHGIVREVMSELLIAQEDNQMSSAGYRGEWLGELIALCQRGLENREAPK